MRYIIIPGRIVEGARTPAGHVLSYKVNGIACFVVTLVVAAFLPVGSDWSEVAFFLYVSGLLSTTVIVTHWSGLLIAANLFESRIFKKLIGQVRVRSRNGMLDQGPPFPDPP